MTDEEIIAAIGFEAATDDVQKRAVDSIRRTVELQIIGMLGDMITDEQEPKFNELMASGDNQAIWDWLKTDVVGVDTRELYEATLQEYLRKYKENELTH
jgi:hypothetical protein